ncbi:hypothetical protein ACHAXT_010987 [Thalassiosira profunda]
MASSPPQMDHGSPKSPAAAKRVAGGLVVKARKKRKKAGASSAIGGGGRGGVPSILTSVPSRSAEESAAVTQQTLSEFDELGDGDVCADAPSDALLCLRTYTRPAAGDTWSETCAYCPIFTSGGDGKRSGAIHEYGNGGSSCRSTHMAPFLPKHVLLHLLNSDASASRMGAEQEIQRLAMANEIRLLQLHGTAADAGSTGGNDDDDVAVMETSVFETAAKMALQSHFDGASQATKQEVGVDNVHSWLTTAFLPHFAGTTWISEWALNSFLQQSEPTLQRQSGDAKSTYTKQYSLSQKKEMVQTLVHAGILLPRRGVGPGAGGEGHWFSLPGLGKAAKSIVDGRANLLRRIRSSKFKEKRRSALVQEIGRIKLQPGGTMEKKQKLEQSGKLVVLDLLAKGWVCVHETCTGEQFVRLVDD